MRLSLVAALLMIPMVASADLQNPDSDDEDDCQQISALIRQCASRPNSRDENCQMLQTQRGLSAANAFIRECQANFGTQQTQRQPGYQGDRQQGGQGGLPGGTASCSVPGVGFIANNTVDQCARIGQAYKGQSVWGGHQLSMAYGKLMIDGQPAGMVANPSGTYGSLSQRCENGDQQACQQWGNQSQQNSQQYQRMYPPGWNSR